MTDIETMIENLQHNFREAVRVLSENNKNLRDEVGQLREELYMANDELQVTIQYADHLEIELMAAIHDRDEQYTARILEKKAATDLINSLLKERSCGVSQETVDAYNNYTEVFEIEQQ